MNTDKVLALAREAGLAVTISSHDSLHKFAALLQREIGAEAIEELRKALEISRKEMERRKLFGEANFILRQRDEAIDRARSANDKHEWHKREKNNDTLNTKSS